jgi:hypothetical protein
MHSDILIKLFAFWLDKVVRLLHNSVKQLTAKQSMSPPNGASARVSDCHST